MSKAKKLLFQETSTNWRQILLSSFLFSVSFLSTYYLNYYLIITTTVIIIISIMKKLLLFYELVFEKKNGGFFPRYGSSQYITECEPQECISEKTPYLQRVALSANSITEKLVILQHNIQLRRQFLATRGHFCS